MRGVWFFPMFISDNPWVLNTSAATFEQRRASEAAIRACADGG
jgi:hypothetical protein